MCPQLRDRGTQGGTSAAHSGSAALATSDFGQSLLGFVMPRLRTVLVQQGQLGLAAALLLDSDISVRIR